MLDHAEIATSYQLQVEIVRQVIVSITIL